MDLRWLDVSTNKREGDGARPVVLEGRGLGNGVVQRGHGAGDMLARNA